MNFPGLVVEGDGDAPLPGRSGRRSTVLPRPMAARLNQPYAPVVEHNEWSQPAPVGPPQNPNWRFVRPRRPLPGADPGAGSRT
jgi:hypothetical protein